MTYGSEAWGPWNITFDPTGTGACEDYGVTGVSFLVPKTTYPFVEWSNPFIECENHIVYSGFAAPPFPGGTIGEGPGTCVPGQAEFDLVRHDVLARDGALETLQLAALSTTPLQVTGSASIRELEILDLGGHDSVHLGVPFESLQMSGADFIGGQDLTPADGVQTFAPGQLPFSTALGAASADGSESTPRVRIRWSCDDAVPATSLDLGNTFRWTPPAALGLAHPVTVGVHAGQDRLWVAPQGRAVDAMQLELKGAGSTRGFAGRLSAWNASVSGTLRQTPAGLEMKNLVITSAEGSEFPVPDQVLPAI